MTGWDVAAAAELGFAAGFVTGLCYSQLWSLAKRQVARHRQVEREINHLLIASGVATWDELYPPMTDAELVGKTPAELRELLLDSRITTNQARKAMGIGPAAGGGASE